jgi:hypothetical protein
VPHERLEILNLKNRRMILGPFNAVRGDSP